MYTVSPQGMIDGSLLQIKEYLEYAEEKGRLINAIKFLLKIINSEIEKQEKNSSQQATDGYVQKKIVELKKEKAELKEMETLQIKIEELELNEIERNEIKLKLQEKETCYIKNNQKKNRSYFFLGSINSREDKLEFLIKRKRSYFMLDSINSLQKANNFLEICCKETNSSITAEFVIAYLTKTLSNFNIVLTEDSQKSMQKQMQDWNNKSSIRKRLII
jgi:hypothetical protein